MLPWPCKNTAMIAKYKPTFQNTPLDILDTLLRPVISKKLANKTKKIDTTINILISRDIIYYINILFYYHRGWIL